MLPRSKEKQTQFEEFERQFISQSHSVSTVVGLSNDWKKLLTMKNPKTGKRELLCLTKDAKRRWLRLTPLGKSQYNARKLHLLIQPSQQYLEERLDSYMSTLGSMLSKAQVSQLYHTSVLERKYSNQDDLQLEICFAALNSLLFSALKKLVVKNRLGQTVQLRYISLTRQYHSPQSFQGYREDEWRKWVTESRERTGKEVYLAHRSISSMKSVYKIIDEAVNGGQ